MSSASNSNSNSNKSTQRKMMDGSGGGDGSRKMCQLCSEWFPSWLFPSHRELCQGSSTVGKKAFVEKRMCRYCDRFQDLVDLEAHETACKVKPGLKRSIAVDKEDPGNKQMCRYCYRFHYIKDIEAHERSCEQNSQPDTRWCHQCDLSFPKADFEAHRSSCKVKSRQEFLSFKNLREDLCVDPKGKKTEVDMADKDDEKKPCRHCHRLPFIVDLESHERVCAVKSGKVKSRQEFLTFKNLREDLCVDPKGKKAEVDMSDKDDEKKLCRHCHRLPFIVDLDSHERVCAVMSGQKPPTGKNLHHYQSWCHGCENFFSEAGFEAHKRTCLVKIKKDLMSYISFQAKLKRNKVEADLAALKERLKMAVNVLVTGSHNTGKTSMYGLLSSSDKFKVLDFPCNVLDAFIIRAMCFADSVILVIDGSIPFSSGCLMYCCIALSLGFKELVCSFNKMDSVGNPKGVYEELKKFCYCLRRLGFDLDLIRFVPTCACNGDNIAVRSARFGWYQGDTLLGELDRVHRPFKRERPLRVGVFDVKEDGLVVVVVHSGILARGQLLVFCPGDWSSVVEEITVGGLLVPKAYPGERAALRLKRAVNREWVKCGVVASLPGGDRVKEADVLTVELLNVTRGTITSLSRAVYTVCCHFAQVLAQVAETFYDVEGGGLGTMPVSLAPLGRGLVQLVLYESIAVETYMDYPILGRVFLVDTKSGDSVATGIVTAVNLDPVDPPTEPAHGPSTSKTTGGSSTKKKKKRFRNYK